MRTVLRLLAALLLLISTPAYADYLEVMRLATLKRAPEREAATIGRPEIGSFLTLLDEGRQRNGYYRATNSSGDTGWIYRSLVRRFRGDAPGAAPPRVSTGPVGTDRTLSGNVMRVHAVDVGQGNAALLEFTCGVIMIDAGGQDDETTERLIAYLTKFFDGRPELNRTINTIFITHAHIDHNRALRKVIETFTVKNYVHDGGRTGSGDDAAIWMIEHANDNGRNIKLRTITQKDVERSDLAKGFTDEAIDPVDCAGTDPRIAVVHGPYDANPGWPHEAFKDENNRSLVIRVDFGKASFLFTGDLEEHAIETMVELFDNTKALDVDVYHVGHHGSRNGTTESLMKAMTPKIALISMGSRDVKGMWTAWAYGHPRQSIVELLDRWVDRAPGGARTVHVASAVKKFVQYEMAGMVYATGWDGTVIVAANQNGEYAVNRAGR